MVSIGARAGLGRKLAKGGGGGYTGSDIWIKGFREGTTEVRWLDELDDFAMYMEHYDAAFGPKGFYGCAGWELVEKANGEVEVIEHPERCMGCQSQSEKVRGRTLRYAGNAMDKDRRHQIFKIGNNLHTDFDQRYQRTGTITDRNFFIKRVGSGMQNTKYSFDIGDPYKLDGPVPNPVNIYELLKNQYLENFPDGTEPALDDADPRPEESTPPPTTKKAPAGADSQAQSTPSAATKRAAPAPAEHPVESNGRPDFAVMETEDIRAWLKSQDKEFPPRAPRARLIAIANDIPF